jgi:hypothetical protein
MSSDPTSPPAESKIIINGDIPEAGLGILCDEIKRCLEQHIHIANIGEICEILNGVENLVFYATRVFLEDGRGYHGPWPLSMRFKHEDVEAFKAFVKATNGPDAYTHGPAASGYPGKD